MTSDNDDHDALAQEEEQHDEEEQELRLDGKGPFQLFFEDDQNVKPKDQIKWILMVAGIDSKSSHPFSAITKKHKTIFLPTKETYGTEIKRRNPDAKVNLSNTKIDVLKEMLRTSPAIDDPRDNEFISNKVKQYEMIFQAQCESGSRGDMEKQGDGRQTMKDRLRFILAFEDDAIISKYRTSQNINGRQLTDARNSVNRESTFFEAISDKCNNQSWVPKTEALPNLHDDFAESFECPKSSFTFTPKNSKLLLQRMKNSLNTIIERYEQSGNGSNMLASDDDDSENEEGRTRKDIGRAWGRFNKERAERVHSRRYPGEILKDGDDRASFLKHNSSDLLYWWHALDQYDLIYFTLAELDGTIAASSHDVPTPTTRGMVASSSSSMSSSRPASKKQRTSSTPEDDGSSDFREEQMVNAIRGIHKRMGTALLADDRKQLENLKGTLFKLEMQRMTPGLHSEMRAVIDGRISDLKSQINEYNTRIVDAELNGPIVPNEIDFE